MKRALCLGILLLLSRLEAASLDVTVNAEAAVLMNAETGAILYEKNADVVRYPASLTKIATALYALQRNRNYLDREIVADGNLIGTVKEDEKKNNDYKKIPSWRLEYNGTHMGIKKGEKLQLRVLLYGLMLSSDND